MEEESSDVLSPIDIGDNLPSLVLKTEKGEDIQVADLTAEHGLVLFLYQKPILVR
jgi:peroxiredoxin Q/BCP